MPLPSWLQINQVWRFPKWCTMSRYLNGLQSYSTSKLESLFFIEWMDILKLWQSTTLQPLKLQGHTAPFWKPPNLINLEPRGQGNDSAFRMRQIFLKWAHLLHRLCFFKFHVEPTVHLWDAVAVLEQVPWIPRNSYIWKSLVLKLVHIQWLLRTLQIMVLKYKPQI